MHRELAAFAVSQQKRHAQYHQQFKSCHRKIENTIEETDGVLRALVYDPIIKAVVVLIPIADDIMDRQWRMHRHRDK